jgi:isopentenyl-diphosphate Delta-isomerase
MIPRESWVILVNTDDQSIGHAEKMYAHSHNLLHRAFSIMLFDHDQPDMCLIQQRQNSKYHCPNLWSNACCSHPMPNESIEDAAQRRLKQELNISTPLTHIGSFCYQEDLDNNLHEHEYDHLFTGFTSMKEPIPFNKDEIQAVKWVNIHALYDDIKQSPDHYTPWFKYVLAHLQQS